jgi:hypothetical protein
MYCSKCGTENDDNAFNCVKCGEVLQQIDLNDVPPAKKIPSYLVQAILVTLLCCLPFGIVAIIFAAQVNGKLNAGDYEGAQRASNSAKTWCWISFGIGLAIMLLGIISAIAIPQFSAYRMRSYDAAGNADLRNASTAQEAYFVDHSTYADSIEELLGDDYGLYISEGVVITVIYANETQYVMEAFHERGSKKFRIVGPGGVIESIGGF